MDKYKALRASYFLCRWVLKCNVYLTDMRDFDVMNAEFAKVFPNDPPARTTVEARLADATMLVEIEAIAWVESK